MGWGPADVVGRRKGLAGGRGRRKGSPWRPQGRGTLDQGLEDGLSHRGRHGPLRGHGGRVYLGPVPRAPSAVFRAENGSGQLCCSRVQHGCTRGQRGCTGRRQSAGRSVRCGAAANG